jgi:hypothetical protein
MCAWREVLILRQQRLVPRRSHPKHTFDQTGQTGFAQKSPNDQQGQKPSKRTPNATKLGPEDFLGREQHTCQKSSRTATVTKTGPTCFPNRSDRFRPDRQEKRNPRKPPLLPTNRSPDSPNGLQPNFGGRWITSWATSISRDPSRNASKREESKVNCQEQLFLSSSKHHQIEAILEGLLEQNHQEKRHKVLIRHIQQESLKETPQNFPTEIPRKGSKNHQKGKREEHKQALRNYAESSIHTMKGSYKV